MLLSRTAEDIYWLGRHLERTDALARIVREHTRLLIDLPVDVDSDWSALLAITGSGELLYERYPSAGEDEVMTFLMADVANPSSLIRTVSAARENFRTARPSLPNSAWECLNALHLDVVAKAGDCRRRSDRIDLTDSVTTSMQRLIGILSTVVSRDDAWRFLELGRAIERADMTTRVIDVRAGALMSSAQPCPSDLPPADRSPYEDVRWLGVLRCLGAQHMYRRSCAASVEGESVVGFLIGDPHFPRSVRHCVEEASMLLRALPERHGTKRALAELRNVIDSVPVGPLRAEALHTYLDDTQLVLAELHDTIEDAYFALTTAETTPVGPNSAGSNPAGSKGADLATTGTPPTRAEQAGAQRSSATHDGDLGAQRLVVA